MPEKNILLQAFDARWLRLRKEWNRTQHRYSEGAVHDLRVASRRLIAVLETLRDVVDDPQIQECRRRVKKSLAALSPFRDVHVQSQRVSRLTRRYPQLKPFLSKLNDQEARNVRKVQKVLKKGPKVSSVIAKAKKRAEEHLDDNELVVGILDKRHAEVIRLAEKVDPTDTATIHRTRLAFKRFRYTAEIVQPLTKNVVTKARLKEFHAFQTMMGDIQDVEVLSARLAKWAGREEKRSEELRPVLLELERQKQKNVATFMESLDKLHSFWRAL